MIGALVKEEDLNALVKECELTKPIGDCDLVEIDVFKDGVIRQEAHRRAAFSGFADDFELLDFLALLKSHSVYFAVAFDGDIKACRECASDADTDTVQSA